MTIKSSQQTLYLANPRGFCAGVERALTIVDKALAKFGTPLYVNHAIVHNTFIVKNLEKKGIIFTDDLDQISEKSAYIFSAHGVSPVFRAKVAAKNIQIIDATCPLVTKVHWEAAKFKSENFKILYVGQRKHQEYLGVAGGAEMQLIENLEQAQKINSDDFANNKVVCLSQTTLSLNDTQAIFDTLKTKIPHLHFPGDICYATTNRQKSVSDLAKKSDFIIVIGSQNSSNSNKLVSAAQKNGCEAALFENVTAIPENVFEYQNIGLTSGASVPEELIQEVIKKIEQKNSSIEIEIINTLEENLTFPLPPEIN